MTKEEYDKVCELLDSFSKPLWTSPTNVILVIRSSDIPYIEKKLKELVKEKTK